MRPGPALLILLGCALTLVAARPCEAQDAHGGRERYPGLISLAARPCEAEDAQSAQAAWTAALAGMTFKASDYERLQAFVQSDPDLVFATLRDGWKHIGDVTVRQSLIQLLVNGAGLRMANGNLGDSYSPNPHLLEILALGLTDPTIQIRNTAAQALGGIAFRDIRTPEDLQEWLAAVGEGTLAQRMDRACRTSLAALESPRMDERANAFRRLLQAPFHSGRYTSTAHGATSHGIGVSGLTALRRKVAKDAGMIELATRSLKPECPAPVRELALRLIAHFGPDDATLARLEFEIRREAPPLLDRSSAADVYDLLAQIKARWVTDMLMKRIAEVDASRAFMSWPAANALGNAGDPRAIPCLIALYDAANPAEYLGQVIERSLSLLANLPYQFNNGHDGDWWRDWWQEHKEEFPAEARAMPYPQIAGIHREEGFSLRRHSERRTIGAGPVSSYWLLSPGIVSVPSETAPPGLIVVLSDTPYTPALSKFWQDTAGRAWDGRYLVALVPRPAAAPGAALPALRDLAAEAARDAQARTPIDPRRVYMLGAGGAGLDVYACSLERSTPFRGFLLLTSPFRTAQLPPLAAAKGRSYYLLHDRADHAAPYILAQAAATLLKHQGAFVRLAALEPSGPARLSALHAAVQWLEMGIAH